MENRLVGSRVEKTAQIMGFPWPEVRDFMSAMISLGLARQNLMIGEQMAERETDPDKAKVIVDSLVQVRQNVADLQEMVNVANARVEKALSQRIVLPH